MCGVRTTPSPAIVHYPPLMTARRAHRALAFVLVVSACAGGTATARLPSAAGAGAARDPLAAPWVLAPSMAPRTQQLVITARLVTETDSLVREDTLQSALTAEWAVAPGDAPMRWVGRITDFRVRVGALDSAAVPADLVLPLRFEAEGVGAGAQPRLPESEDATCADANAAIVNGWRELWLAPPSPLSPGTTWQDSATYTLCRDGIPLRVHSVRTYVAESATLRDGAAHAAVVRRSRVMLEGTGVQFGDTVRVIGGGSSTVRLLLPLAGTAMTGEGEGVLTLELRGRRRAQRLTQESVLEIRAP